MVGLEEAGVAYNTELVVYVRGDNKSPEYLNLNPNGKVPTMVVDGVSITESSAMMIYLAQAFPEANLLPFGGQKVTDAKIIADVIWCSTSIHPNVFHIRLPQFFCDEQSGMERVRDMAMERLERDFHQIEDRLGHGPWFFGEQWSLIDAYLSWAWFRLNGTSFNLQPYPRFAKMYERVLKRPSVQRVLAKEQEAYDWLERNDLMVNFQTFSPSSKK